VVTLVGQSLRQREHDPVQFSQESPTQPCLAPDGSHLIPPTHSAYTHGPEALITRQEMGN
jgi:hypothetical protein